MTARGGLTALTALGASERTRRALTVPTPNRPEGGSPVTLVPAPRRVPTITTPALGADPHTRSITMHSIDEALARDRIREAQNRAHSARLARDLAAQRRWHRVSRYAQRAEARHAAHVRQVAVR